MKKDQYSLYFDNATARIAGMVWRLVWVIAGFVVLGFLLNYLAPMTSLSGISGAAIAKIITYLSVIWIILVAPWGVHFEAKNALDRIKEVQEQKIEVSDEVKGKVNRIHKYTLALAILLHVGTAALIAGYAYINGGGALDFAAAGVALASSIIRPVMRKVASDYAYLARVQDNEIQVPQARIITVEKQLEGLVSFKKEADAVVNKVAGQMKANEENIKMQSDEITATLQQYEAHVKQLQESVSEFQSNHDSAIKIVNTIAEALEDKIRSMNVDTEMMDILCEVVKVSKVELTRELVDQRNEKIAEAKKKTSSKKNKDK